MPVNTPPITPKVRTKIVVYFLAAIEDEKTCKAIKKYLSPVIRNSEIPIEIHSDFEIPAGEDTKEYKQQLYEADIVLAFISADYINDDGIYERSQRVITRHNRNETIMLPILVRNCMWKSTPFVNLPLLPKNIQPLNNKHFWNSEDDALTSVVNDINEAINAFHNEETIEKVTTVKTKQAPPQNITQVSSSEVSTERQVDQQPIENALNTKVEKPVSQRKANIPIEVDWRKGYYKDVYWKRGIAFLLDNLLTFVPAVIISFILGVVLFTGDSNPDDVVILDILISISGYLIICAAMESSKWRGTFGKLIMKLQVTDNEGHQISFFRALGRNVLRLIIGYSYLLLIPLIIQIFTFKKSKKFFHDQLSNTVIGEKLTSQ
jgi:uncharacterized RDD family membrane protein YckC